MNKSEFALTVLSLTLSANICYLLCAHANELKKEQAIVAPEKPKARLKGRVREDVQNPENPKLLNGTASESETTEPLTGNASIVIPIRQQAQIAVPNTKQWDEIMAFTGVCLNNGSTVSYVALLGNGDYEPPNGQYFTNLGEWNVLTDELKNSNLRGQWDQWAHTLNNWLSDRWTVSPSGYGHIQFRIIIRNRKITSIQRVPRPYCDEYGVEHGRTIEDMDGDQNFRDTSRNLATSIDNSSFLIFPSASQVKELQVYIFFAKPRPWKHQIGPVLSRSRLAPLGTVDNSSSR